VEREVLPEPTLAYHGMASGGREGLAKISGGGSHEVDSKGNYRAPWEIPTMVATDYDCMFDLMASTAVHAASDIDSHYINPNKDVRLLDLK
jgi:hypothetical protein